jgi:hypothetical protein
LVLDVLGAGTLTEVGTDAIAILGWLEGWFAYPDDGTPTLRHPDFADLDGIDAIRGAIDAWLRVMSKADPAHDPPLPPQWIIELTLVLFGAFPSPWNVRS